jgi:hypothetical protein
MYSHFHKISIHLVASHFQADLFKVGETNYRMCSTYRDIPRMKVIPVAPNDLPNDAKWNRLIANHWCLYIIAGDFCLMYSSYTIGFNVSQHVASLVVRQWGEENEIIKGQTMRGRSMGRCCRNRCESKFSSPVSNLRSPAYNALMCKK